MSRSKSKTSQAKVGAAKRRVTVITLRLAGYTIRQIAEQVDCGVATVKRDLDKMLTEYDTEAANQVAEYRALQSARIEEAIKGIWLLVKSGNVSKIDRFVRLCERQARLLGLDKPTKIAPTTPDGDEPFEMTDDEIESELKRIINGES